MSRPIENIILMRTQPATYRRAAMMDSAMMAPGREFLQLDLGVLEVSAAGADFERLHPNISSPRFASDAMEQYQWTNFILLDSGIRESASDYNFDRLHPALRSPWFGMDDAEKDQWTNFIVVPPFDPTTVPILETEPPPVRTIPFSSDDSEKEQWTNFVIIPPFDPTTVPLLESEPPPIRTIPFSTDSEEKEQWINLIFLPPGIGSATMGQETEQINQTGGNNWTNQEIGEWTQFLIVPAFDPAEVPQIELEGPPEREKTLFKQDYESEQLTGVPIIPAFDPQESPQAEAEPPPQAPIRQGYEADPWIGLVILESNTVGFVSGYIGMELPSLQRFPTTAMIESGQEYGILFIVPPPVPPTPATERSVRFGFSFTSFR